MSKGKINNAGKNLNENRQKIQNLVFDMSKSQSIHTQNLKANHSLDSHNTQNLHKSSTPDSSEVVFELKHTIFVLDKCFYVILLFFSIMSIYTIINSTEEIVRYNPILWFIALMIPFYYRQLCYFRKNKIYVTNDGIYFEKTYWFRIRKEFFKFGEIGFVGFPISNARIESANCFVYYSIIHHKPKKHIFLNFPFMPKYYHKIYLHEQDTLNIQALLTFIRQKTKESLESQGKHISDEELREKIKYIGKG